MPACHHSLQQPAGLPQLVVVLAHPHCGGGRERLAQQRAPPPAALQAEDLHGMECLCGVAVAGATQAGARGQPHAPIHGKHDLFLQQGRAAGHGGQAGGSSFLCILDAGLLLVSAPRLFCVSIVPHRGHPTAVTPQRPPHCTEHHTVPSTTPGGAPRSRLPRWSRGCDGARGPLPAG